MRTRTILPRALGLAALLIAEPIKLLDAYQRTRYHPTTWSVRFDDRANEYVIALGGLTLRTAS